MTNMLQKLLFCAHVRGPQLYFVAGAVSFLTAAVCLDGFDFLGWLSHLAVSRLMKILHQEQRELRSRAR